MVSALLNNHQQQRRQDGDREGREAQQAHVARLHAAVPQEEGRAHGADAERGDGRHVGLQRDAQRRDHVRVLDAGAHDAAEGGTVEQQPDAGDAGDGDQQQDAAVARVDEVADEDVAGFLDLTA